jgi:hypothetical protein
MEKANMMAGLKKNFSKKLRKLISLKFENSFL